MVKGILTADSTTHTSNTKTQLNNANSVTMPIWARCLRTVSAWGVLGGFLTAAQPTVIKYYLESNDATVVPYEWVPNSLASSLQGTTTASQPMTPIEKFPVHAPLRGGEDFQLYAEPQTAITNAVWSGVAIVVSDMKDKRQKFAKVGTYTSTGTTACTDVAGTAYTLNGCESIVEVYGHTAFTTVVANLPIQGSFRFASSDFKTAVPLRFAFQPTAGALSTTAIPYNAGVIRYKVDVPTQISCALTDYGYFDTIATTAGRWITGVLFEKLNFP